MASSEAFPVPFLFLAATLLCLCMFVYLALYVPVPKSSMMIIYPSDFSVSSLRDSPCHWNLFLLKFGELFLQRTLWVCFLLTLLVLVHVLSFHSQLQHKLLSASAASTSSPLFFI